MADYLQDILLSDALGLRGPAENQFGSLVRQVLAETLVLDRTERMVIPYASDLEDVSLSRQGDPEAYRRLVERYQGQVSKVLWRFSRDQTVHEQLIQDVFVEAYLSLRSYQAKAPFGHWLSKIATRVGFHFWKARARHTQNEGLSVQQWDQIHTDEPERIEAADSAELLHRLLALLPPRDRLVLTLRYLEELNVAETAARIGWTQTMVKVQTMRARKKLEKLFISHEQEPLS